MYVWPNFQTKKNLKEAVEDGIEVSVFSPGPFDANQNGIESVEGPHGTHKWYAQVTVTNGKVTGVK